MLENLVEDFPLFGTLLVLSIPGYFKISHLALANDKLDVILKLIDDRVSNFFDQPLVFHMKFLHFLAEAFKFEHLYRKGLEFFLYNFSLLFDLFHIALSFKMSGLMIIPHHCLRFGMGMLHLFHQTVCTPFLFKCEIPFPGNFDLSSSHSLIASSYFTLSLSSESSCVNVILLISKRALHNHCHQKISQHCFALPLNFLPPFL